jgi:hypothetical protein
MRAEGSGFETLLQYLFYFLFDCVRPDFGTKNIEMGTLNVY